MTAIKEQDIKIGCDPELFVVNKKTGNYISAHDLVPGTKKAPYQLPYNQSSVQADGTAVEFNIPPMQLLNDEFQTSTRERRRATFLTKVKSTMQIIAREFLASRNSDYALDPKPCIEYPEHYFLTLPKKAIELGCEPDFNAYTGKRNVLCVPKDKPFMRTGAGHIHIGWTKDADVEDDDHLLDCRMMVINFDKLYQASRLGKKDAATDRTKLYGQAGCFRPKPYGVEYRSPSNMWLQSDDDIKGMFDLAAYTVAYTLTHGCPDNKEIVNKYQIMNPFNGVEPIANPVRSYSI